MQSKSIKSKQSINTIIDSVFGLTSVIKAMGSAASKYLKLFICKLNTFNKLTFEVDIA